MVITFYKRNRDGKTLYYTVHDRQGDFFNPHTFTALWGRVPSNGREKVYHFADSRHMYTKLRSLFKRRILNGYRILYRFSKSSEYTDLFIYLDSIRVS